MIEPHARRLLVAGEHPRARRHRPVCKLPRQAMRRDLAAVDLQPTGAALRVDGAEPSVVLSAPVDLRLEALGKRCHVVLLCRSPADLAGGIEKDDSMDRGAVDRRSTVAPGCIAPGYRGVYRARDTRRARTRYNPPHRRTSRITW